MAATPLQELLDKDAIRSVLMRYCRGIDRQDGEILRTVYHPDAVDHHGAFTGGPDEFIPWVLHQTDNELTHHALSTINIEVHGDVAFSEAYVRAEHTTLGSAGNAESDGPTINTPTINTPTINTIVGRYLDRFERREGTWRIAKRTVVIDYREVRPLHRVETPYPRSRHDRDDLLYELLEGGA